MDPALVERMNQLSEKVRLILEDSENLKRSIAERMVGRAAQQYVEAPEAPEAHEAPEASEAPETSEAPDTSEVSDNSSETSGDQVDYEQKATEPLEMSDSDVGTSAFDISSDDEHYTSCCWRRC